MPSFALRKKYKEITKMATVTNYDELYTNMKNRLTVVNDNSEYTIGDYMLMRANKKKVDSLLPVAEKTATRRTEAVVVNAFSYINEKLTIKQPPVKDKTLKAFPFRTSASAFLSAVVACAFMLSFVAIGAKIIGNAPVEATQVSLSEEVETNVETA